MSSTFEAEQNDMYITVIAQTVQKLRSFEIAKNAERCRC